MHQMDQIANAIYLYYFDYLLRMFLLETIYISMGAPRPLLSTTI
jgi:hypothetical protein